MAKTQTIKFSDFMNGSYKHQAENIPDALKKVVTASGGALIVILPKSVLAASVEGTFGNVHAALMRGIDSGVVLVIIFAGCAWMMGHRPKAIEILLGVCCGYILARHAVDIRDFLRGI